VIRGTSFKTRAAGLLTFAIVLAAAAITPTHASFHEWKITEVYSNSSGSVQFVEMFDPFGGENFINTFGASLSSGSHSYSFPDDLAGDTTNKHLLIATPGYAALNPSHPPDFTFAANNFFSTSGDTINYDGLDSLTFASGQLPTDGLQSLNRSWGDTTSGAAAAATPTNFAGDVGQVPEPASVTLAAAALGYAWAARRRRGR
jgi:hypothetical protein